MRGVSSQLITHADGRVFLRHGDCDGCRVPGLVQAACCRYLELPLARPLTPAEIRWAELHAGVSIVPGEFISYVHFNVACDALTPEGDCSLFGTPERPAMCETAPAVPEQLLAGCAYELEEIK